MRRTPPNGRSPGSSDAGHRRDRRSSGATPTHARELVDEALNRGTDALVVVGGDGVISLALQALARTDVPLGIVPAGTGNDHAREYRLPTADPERAVDIIAAGHIETVDLGHIKGVRRQQTHGSAPSPQRVSTRWSPIASTG